MAKLSDEIIQKLKMFSGFYRLSSKERLQKIQKIIPELNDDEVSLLLNTGSLELTIINKMVENAVGSISVPFGLGVNFVINNKLYAVPMVVEEPSVIAAASSAAKLTLETGGFITSATEQIMMGQIQLLEIKNPELAISLISSNKDQIIEIANSNHPSLISHGGGVRDVKGKVLETRVGKMVICELFVDCCDAMGANAVSAMAEEVAPFLEDLTGGRALLRILSNLSDLRLARASCIIPKEKLGGETTVDNIVAACAFAETDPYRAATHNKGIMNGISSVILATANDTRAIEAGAHAYASITGHYGSLTKWIKNEMGDLEGSIEVPMAVGIVGGATKTNPIAKIALKIMAIKSAKELAQVAVAVGLAQNLGALRALSTSGIIKGHMRLHSKNVAISAGAQGELIDTIAQKMVEEKNVKFSRAKELLVELDVKK